MNPNTLRKKTYSEEDDRIICRVCGKKWSHLGSHLWHKHKILAKDYKEEHGLPYNFSLISATVFKKKSDHFEEHREEYTKALLANTGSRFVKGRPAPKGQYRSDRALANAVKNLDKMNSGEWETCPICNMQFRHMTSHLYNKHKMLKVE